MTLIVMSHGLSKPMERLGLAQQWDIEKEFITEKVVRHGIWAIRLCPAGVGSTAQDNFPIRLFFIMNGSGPVFRGRGNQFNVPHHAAARAGGS